MRTGRARRGGIYVAVLMTAVCVGVIGFSALATTRLQLAESVGDRQVTAARFYAQSAVDFALLTLNETSDWRTEFTSGAWRSAALGDGQIAWQIVDEADGDLTTVPDGPLRLYGRGTCGTAVRIYSVELDTTGVAGSDLLENGGLESGLDPWSGYGLCDLALVGDAYSGAAACRATNRSATWAGPGQDVDQYLVNGQQYRATVWVKNHGLTDLLSLRLMVVSSGDGTQYLESPGTLTVGGVWTRLSTEFTPTWTGTLNRAVFYLKTSLATADFSVDAATFEPLDADESLQIVEGSWRREAG